MPLPDPLPSDPDELETLYQDFIAQDDYRQEDHDRLMTARLRVWGIDPDNMTAEQLIGAMQESMNRMLLNLRSAIEVAPDEESAARIVEAMDMAKKLREDIDQALEDAKRGGEDLPQ